MKTRQEEGDRQQELQAAINTIIMVDPSSACFQEGEKAEEIQAQEEVGGIERSS